MVENKKRSKYYADCMEHHSSPSVIKLNHPPAANLNWSAFGNCWMEQNHFLVDPYNCFPAIGVSEGIWGMKQWELQGWHWASQWSHCFQGADNGARIKERCSAAMWWWWWGGGELQFLPLSAVGACCWGGGKRPALSTKYKQSQKSCQKKKPARYDCNWKQRQGRKVKEGC